MLSRARTEDRLDDPNRIHTVAELPGDVVKLAVAFPKVSLLWLVGVALYFLAAAPAAPAAAVEAYESRLPTAEDTRALLKLEAKSAAAYDAYRQSRSWLGLSCSGECPDRHREWRVLDVERAALETRLENKVKDAKAQLPLWSAEALEETRDVWRERWGYGKRVAKQQNTFSAMGHAFGAMLSGRDDGVERFIAFVFEVVLAWLISMLFSVLSFAYYAAKLALAYKAHVMLAVLFWGASVLAAAAYLASLLAGAGLVVTAVFRTAVGRPRRALPDAPRQAPPPIIDRRSE